MSDINNTELETVIFVSLFLILWLMKPLQKTCCKGFLENSSLSIWFLARERPNISDKSTCIQPFA